MAPESLLLKADVAVKGDKVARIAPDIQEPAAEVYDAAGKYVIPGLIDPHVHEEWYCFDDGRYESYIRQGVTTLVNGNCSHSITPGHKKEVLDYYLGNGLGGTETVSALSAETGPTGMILRGMLRPWNRWEPTATLSPCWATAVSASM